jgi:dephospho-CoA kinase
MLIGLVGTLGSGKGVVRGILENKGFKSRVFSDLLKDELNEISRTINRKNLQDIGNDIRVKEGKNALAVRLVNSLDLNENCVVDGSRNPAEVEELKRKGFVIISLDAPRKLRFDRLLFRRSEKDPKTWEEFLEVEKRDLKEDDPAGQQVQECMRLADYSVMNDLNYGDLFQKIDNVLEKIRKKC